jgi:hypothetical protein
VLLTPPSGRKKWQQVSGPEILILEFDLEKTVQGETTG